MTKNEVHIFSSDGFIREKKLRSILKKDKLNEDDVYKLLYSLSDRVWAIPILVGNNIDKIDDELLYKFYINNEDLYYYIRGKMISIWNNYHQDSSWYQEYPNMPQKLKDYTPYKAIKKIEGVLRNKYGLSISKSRNK